jgi:hypothetical protein
VFDTEDTKKAKEFAASADLKEAMIKAGVGGPADNLFSGIDRLRRPADASSL